MGLELKIIIGCVLVVVGRFTVPGHGFSWPGTYEAVAHIWVGVLVGIGCVNRHRQNRTFAWAALAVITVIEIVAALLRS